MLALPWLWRRRTCGASRGCLLKQVSLVIRCTTWAWRCGGGALEAVATATVAAGAIMRWGGELRRADAGGGGLRDDKGCCAEMKRVTRQPLARLGDGGAATANGGLHVRTRASA